MGHYNDSTGRTLPCFDITRKGCEFIANKLTGQKGTIFTATYINRFHEMEQKDTQVPKLQQDKDKRLEIQEMNAKARLSSVYLRLLQVDTLSTEYKNILAAKAVEILEGKPLLPPIESKQKTYTATELAKMFGISAQKIGTATNAHNLKTKQYGEWYRDKSRYSNKEVDSFRYYDTVIPVIEKILNLKASV